MPQVDEKSNASASVASTTATSENTPPPMAKKPSVSFDNNGPSLASKKNSINTTNQQSSSRIQSQEKKMQLSEELKESPSVMALSSLRCPSPPPILQHPNPVTSRNDCHSFLLAATESKRGSDNISRDPRSNTLTYPTSPTSILTTSASQTSIDQTTSALNRQPYRETVPAGGALLRNRVANQAVVAAVAAHAARDRIESNGRDRSPTPTSPNATPSKLTESLKKAAGATTSLDNSPDMLTPPVFHQRTGSMHAHFYVEDTLKHPQVRSRSASTSTTDGKSILETIQSGVPTVQAGPTSTAIGSGGFSSNPGSQAPSAPMTAAGVNARLPHDDGKLHVLFGACGSISIKKTRLIIGKLEEIYKDKISIQLILTKASEHFVSRGEFPTNVQIWKDKDEWTTWNARTDPVLHIELRRWADILIIAPLSANTLTKIALGLCDNLLTNVVRAWNTQYPIILAPAMVSFAYTSQVTKRHAKVIKEDMKWIEILKPTEKVVSSYGEIGMGGMMDWNEIVDKIVQKLGGYPEDDDEDDDDDNNDNNDYDEEEDEDDDDDDDDDGDDDDGSLNKGVRKITVAEEDEINGN